MTDVRVDKALDGIVAMRNERDGVRSDLYDAQSLLLGCFALLDDLDTGRLDALAHTRVTSMLAALSTHLETRPWAQPPATDVPPAQGY